MEQSKLVNNFLNGKYHSIDNKYIGQSVTGGKYDLFRTIEALEMLKSHRYFYLRQCWNPIGISDGGEKAVNILVLFDHKKPAFLIVLKGRYLTAFLAKMTTI